MEGSGSKPEDARFTWWMGVQRITGRLNEGTGDKMGEGSNPADSLPPPQGILMEITPSLISWTTLVSSGEYYE